MLAWSSARHRTDKLRPRAEVFVLSVSPDGPPSKGEIRVKLVIGIFVPVVDEMLNFRDVIPSFKKKMNC